MTPEIMEAGEAMQLAQRAEEELIILKQERNNLVLYWGNYVLYLIT